MLDESDEMLQKLRREIPTWIMSPEELKTVFRSSKPGDVTVYAVGDLHVERLCADAESGRFLAVYDTAELASDLSEAGEACLTQKRLGPHKYEYRITKRAA